MAWRGRAHRHEPYRRQPASCRQQTHLAGARATAERRRARYGKTPLTVSTIAALGKADAQLRSHLGITQRLGVNNQQLQRVFDVLEKEVSPAVAAYAHDVFHTNR